MGSIQPVDRTINFFEVPPNNQARRLIEQNDWTFDQIAQLSICDEHDRERHHVSEKCECSTGCNESNLIDLNGRQVCKWTRMECPRGKTPLEFDLKESLEDE